MIATNGAAMLWLRKIRLTLIARRVVVSRTVEFELSEAGLREAQRAKPGVAQSYAGSPEEALTIALSGVSRPAQRYLRRRGLQRADREDVIQDALLWCWNNRDNYSLSTTLDTWLFNAVRDAYKAWKRKQARNEHANIRV